MTTAAEIRQLAEAGGAEAHRVVFLPSTVLASPQGLDSFAREVAALANREGGRVVLGVSAAGKFEDAPALGREAADAAIGEALGRRIVPPVEAVVEHIAADAGEALVVRMLARSGPPHRAPAANGSGEPTVFVRVGDRTRAATAEQVSWMERVRRDPAVELGWTLATGAGKRCGVDSSLPIADAYRELLERAPAALREQLEASASACVRACAELAPWAFLRDLDAALVSDPEAAIVSLDDLAQPGPRSMIGALPGGVAALLGAAPAAGLASRIFRRRTARPAFRVPQRAEPHVDLLVHQRKGRVMLVHPSWVVTFAASPQEGLEEGTLRLELACALSFPERDGQIESQRQAERIVERVVHSWGAPGD